MKEASAAPAKRIRWGWVVFVLLVLALIVLMVVHLLRSKPAKQGTPAQVVTVSAAQLGDMPETLDALGTVTPYATVTVLPQLSGYLTQVAYREGQDVQKGQLMPRSIRASIKSPSNRPRRNSPRIKRRSIKHAPIWPATHN